MVQNTHLELTRREIKLLQEAFNIIEYGSIAGKQSVESVGQRVYDKFANQPSKAFALAEFWSCLEYHADYSANNFFVQTDFLMNHFYSTTDAAGGLVYFLRRHDDQKADELVNLNTVLAILNRQFSEKLSLVVADDAGAIIPTTVSREYHPNGQKIIYGGVAPLANTWVPPKIKPSKTDRPKQRPSFWQQYLDRLMPKEHLCWWINENENKVIVPQQDYFEAWLAERTCNPNGENIVSIVLRGNSGTGKGFWLDVIAEQMVGAANYQTVNTKAWRGDFDGGMFDSVIIHLEETDETHANTATMLKMLTSQKSHRTNVKNLPQKFVEAQFAIAISSNYRSPIKIEEHDKRYFVPVWSDHFNGSEGKNETQAFFEKFAQYLHLEGGFQELRDWFEEVNISEYNFRMAPETQDKIDISLKIEPSESRKSHLAMWLRDKRDDKVLFTSSALGRDNYPMTAVEVQTALKQAGFVPQVRKFEGTKHNLWISNKDKGAKNLARNGWTLWKGDVSKISEPDKLEKLEPALNPKPDMWWMPKPEEIQKNMSEEEQELLEEIQKGETTVLSRHRHPKLCDWAKKNDLLVNIMRQSSGGTIYGNPSSMEDDNNKERDRVCEEFEADHVHKLSNDDIQALKGKALMCVCWPKRCHGDTLARLANKMP